MTFHLPLQMTSVVRLFEIAQTFASIDYLVMSTTTDDDQKFSKINIRPNTTFLTFGGSGFIYTYPNCPTQVIKLCSDHPNSSANIRIERQVYARLGNHQNIIRCLRIEDDGVLLERAPHGSLREYYGRGGTASLKEKVVWARDTANALHYLHQKGIRHSDLSGKNLLLDSKRMIRLCDFAGSSIDGERATVWPDHGFRHPNEEEVVASTIRAELHSLGSTIYEIMTCSAPYQGFEESEITNWMKEGKYPDVSEMELGAVVLKCWNGEFEFAEEVASEIERTGEFYCRICAKMALC
jgi:serine/threonine protein kinase